MNGLLVCEMRSVVIIMESLLLIKNLRHTDHIIWISLLRPRSPRSPIPQHPNITTPNNDFSNTSLDLWLGIVAGVIEMLVARQMKLFRLDIATL